MIVGGCNSSLKLATKMNLLFFIINIIIFGCAMLPIIFGNESPIENYPYQVSVQDAVSHFCSGSIISEYFVLSAAVCFKTNPDIGILRIHAGSSSTSGGSVHRVARIIPHEKFSYSDKFGTSRNNLALIEVEDPFIFDANRQPIEMLDTNEVVNSNKTGVVSGWPKNDTDKRPEKLLTEKVIIIDRKSCNKAHNDHHQILANEICAVGDDFKFCDLGSPLVIDGHLAGVASWDIVGHGSLDSPKVFTNITYYRNWIIQHARLQ